MDLEINDFKNSLEFWKFHDCMRYVNTWFDINVNWITQECRMSMISHKTSFKLYLAWMQQYGPPLF